MTEEMAAESHVLTLNVTTSELYKTIEKTESTIDLQRRIHFTRSSCDLTCAALVQIGHARNPLRLREGQGLFERLEQFVVRTVPDPFDVAGRAGHSGLLLPQIPSCWGSARRKGACERHAECDDPDLHAEGPQGRTKRESHLESRRVRRYSHRHSRLSPVSTSAALSIRQRSPFAALRASVVSGQGACRTYQPRCFLKTFRPRRSP